MKPSLACGGRLSFNDNALRITSYNVCYTKLLREFNLKQETTNFSVECKWRQNLFKNGIEFATEEQFERYKQFEQKQQHPVFIVIGVGGKALSPEKLYVVPLNELAGNFIPIAKLKRYEKYMDSNFFFNPKTKELR